ncbi:hypothetical protein S7711_11565 [Stachybotrys chartarum IBT 7711]|uniref:Uncharacterized protein n=1 Tax=Stachybotrys chartarum (strain CBS 109288 / IBT 7711) TaxID=1280523 RepID=A0A084AF14_STACB|nr:hypothetical protein S7711_11565 [Stachybotrys chartarum IBT 7711]
MSLITTPALEFLYNESLNDDIEYKDSAFWQHYLILKFPPNERYIVSHEHSPDNKDRQRVDIKVRYLDPHANTAITLLMTECKRKGTSKFKELEPQLSRYAESYFNANPSAEYVYGMTVWGIKARVWTASPVWKERHGHYILKEVILEPSFGPATLNDKNSYIDAGHVYAWYIEAAINDIKNQPAPPKPKELLDLENAQASGSSAP